MLPGRLCSVFWAPANWEFLLGFDLIRNNGGEVPTSLIWTDQQTILATLIVQVRLLDSSTPQS